MEGLLQKNDRMWKIHLKDAYFSVTLRPDSPQFIKIKWKDQIVLWLGASTTDFYKTIENSRFSVKETKYTPHISGRYFNNSVLD